MVPEAHFTSYYGRPIVKPSPWAADIPAYLFLGGLAAGSSILGAGSDLTGRPTLRRSSRVAAMTAISLSFAALVHDLGKPSRFHHMLRVAKPTSPMSVGTWILTGYAPMAGLAVAAEARQLLPPRHRDGPVGALLTGAGRAGGLLAAGLAPAVASYTGVLLSDTATPAWHAARHRLPFLFVGSATAAAGGLGMLVAPLAEAGPARRMAVGGAAFEVVMERQMEAGMGLSVEQRHAGKAGRYLTVARALTIGGGLLAAGWGGRSRAAAGTAGVALMVGSAAARFGTFNAGQQSARDPRYTVVPQRERVDDRERVDEDRVDRRDDRAQPA